MKIYFTHNSAVEKNDEAVRVFVSHQYVIHALQVVSSVVDVVSDAHHFLVITGPRFPHLYRPLRVNEPNRLVHTQRK